MPPSAAACGITAQVENDTGVWAAPANRPVLGTFARADDAGLDEVRAQVLVQAYEARRPLDAAERRLLPALLRAGALAAPMEIIEETTIGPSLGAENIAKGFNSVTYGFAAVAVFMCFYYMLFGVFSSIALAVNLLLLVAMGALAVEAFQRLQAPEPVAGWTVIVVAAIGVLINGITAALCHGG